ncbi:MAG TPA: MaoC family dehydratase [Noviherbaspirillum sp.]|jgi:acyl dehydratase|uniref:MaoC family dehydratase n=1 Tax=Noviherbaspirillum sp. TaxID=1926288 RepID=UPI002DDD9107|nr:MaoC family dehydratase [Noviherbaspirillum sp.]HEV2609236.1 MaoC family dehydratase [Noviherbaspirillum sp.]
MSQLKWYFEDFVVGRTIDIGTRTVSEEEIIDFATKFDPQPFHVDKDAAANSIYGGIIASGWHTCSMMMRMMVDGFLREAASMGSPGVDEVRWLKPVRGGDTLTVTTTAMETRPSASKPDRGVVVNLWQAKNQHGELVATVKGMGLFKRRPPA